MHGACGVEVICGDMDLMDPPGRAGGRTRRLDTVAPAELAGTEPNHAVAQYDNEMVTGGPDLDRVRELHQLRSFRIGSVLRIGVVGLMLGAMLVGTAQPDWLGQAVMLGAYAAVALCAAVIAFTPAATLGMRQRPQLGITIIDVLALTGFQLLSTDGYVPLLVMALLPILVGLDVSLRRAALLLMVSVVAFAFAVLSDSVMEDELGWRETAFVIVVYGFLCSTSLLVVYVEERHANAIVGLTSLREELLAETMTASEATQRRISEALHDGPLQNVLAVQRALRKLADRAPSGELDDALVGLRDTSKQLREATFELHPAVLEQAGLGAAVEQLVSVTAERSGITVSTDIDYPVRHAIDPIMFGVSRELLSNVVRHSQANHASVHLGLCDNKCCLDVADDGIGMTDKTAARRLAEGHIGLASHRTRVEAAGGRFRFVDEPVGTHVHVELPVRD